MNLAANLEHTARFHARGAALVFGAAVVSYRELDRQSRCVAGFLTAKGLRASDRVALMLPNVPEFAPLYYGILRTGAIAVPLSPDLTGPEVDFYLTDSGARVLFTWQPDATGGLPLPRRDAVETVAVAPGALDALLGGRPPFDGVAAREPADTAVILYTSGATDRPKGVALSHGNLVHNTDVVARELVELGPDDVVLGALPLFHCFGQTTALNATVRAGACLALLPRFDAGAALETVQRAGVTVMPATPTMYVGLLNHPARADVDASTLRLCTSGGSALPVEVLLEFERTFGCAVLEGYGLTETSPVATFNRTERRRVGSVGTPLPGVELRIVDEAGRAVADGEPGEVVVRGHNVMTGYWNRPDATAAARPDGWLRTGDIGRRDEDGFFYLVDRKQELIVRAGHTVYPREIEEALYEHPAVLEAAVVGVPDPGTGHEVVALVTLCPGRSVGGEELRTYVKGRVAAAGCPRHVDIVSELPKSSTGKILKREITFEVASRD